MSKRKEQPPVLELDDSAVPGLTSDQNAALFEMHKTAIAEKLAKEAEKHTAELKAAESKLTLEMELKHSESAACIAAMTMRS